VDLNVGQVIYLLSSKGDNIYPAQIIEKIKRKTISDEITSYIVCLPDKNSTILPLDDVKASIFVSLDSVKEKLLEYAKNRINNLLTNASKLESRFNNIEQVSEDFSFEQELNSDDDTALVDLGNGKIAKININQLPVG
jgi:hypothetical protein